MINLNITLGNEFLYKNKIVKIEAITIDMCSVSGYENNRFTPLKLTEIEPIKINEDYIKNKGFVFNTLDNKFKHEDFPVFFIRHPNNINNKLVCFFNNRSLGNIKYTYQIDNFIKSIYF